MGAEAAAYGAGGNRQMLGMIYAENLMNDTNEQQDGANLHGGRNGTRIILALFAGVSSDGKTGIYYNHEWHSDC
jgi:hypothetical protein